MIGAIAGDIVGSRFEWAYMKSKDFELFPPKKSPRYNRRRTPTMPSTPIPWTA